MEYEDHLDMELNETLEAMQAEGRKRHHTENSTLSEGDEEMEVEGA